MAICLLSRPIATALAVLHIFWQVPFTTCVLGPWASEALQTKPGLAIANFRLSSCLPFSNSATCWPALLVRQARTCLSSSLLQSACLKKKRQAGRDSPSLSSCLSSSAMFSGYGGSIPTCSPGTRKNAASFSGNPSKLERSGSRSRRLLRRLPGGTAGASRGRSDCTTAPARCLVSNEKAKVEWTSRSPFHRLLKNLRGRFESCFARVPFYVFEPPPFQGGGGESG